MSSTLTHRIDEYGEHWTVEGARGAVTLLRGLTTGIELHSRTPWPGEEDEPPSTTCPFVDGPVHCEGRGEPGVRLLARYRETGDEQVIWDQLQLVYADLPEVVS